MKTNNDKIYTEKEYNDKWREGYDAGMKNAMKMTDNERKIGRAILDVLDGRYEFKEEDYD